MVELGKTFRTEHELLRHFFGPVPKDGTKKLLVIGPHVPRADRTPAFLASIGREMMVKIIDAQSLTLRAEVLAAIGRLGLKAEGKAGKEKDSLRGRIRSIFSRLESAVQPAFSGQGDGMAHVKEWETAMEEKYGTGWRRKRREGSLHFVQGDWMKMQLKTSAHDGILCRGTYHWIARQHPDNKREIVERMIRTAKPGAPIVIEFQLGRWNRDSMGIVAREIAEAAEDHKISFHKMTSSAG